MAPRTSGRSLTWVARSSGRRTANSRDTSNRGSTGCDRSKPRGKEESVAEELLRDRREDLDREQVEIEIVADTRESREIEDRRETLQVEFILDTFRRILDRKNRDLREHTDQLRKAPQSNKFEALIAQDKLDIRALEDSIRRVQGGSF